jgi:putative OPT family oligopeptide transporter
VSSQPDAAQARPWSSTAPPEEFRPFIPPEEEQAEFSLRAVLLGAVFGIVFGAVTVYVGLRAGLTVGASIPIAVLSITILRAFGKAGILENNLVQTIGSAGESVAGGVIFTIPALIFLGFPFEYSRIFLLALLGGCLGVLFMIPLRRQLIVKEHGNLLYPEGTACADVLVAGERGGSFAGRVFWGLGLGGVYTFSMTTLGLWPGQPDYQPRWFPGASFRASITSEYLGVGYIIGPRVAGTIFAGGVFSWLVLMPAIKFFGSLVPDVPLYPSTIPIPQMSPDDLWRSYIRPMGAGAVAAAGLITLMKTLPTIWAALRAGMKDVRKSGAAGAQVAGMRTERDFPMNVVVFGSLAIVAMMWALLTFKPVPNAETGAGANLLAAVFVVFFGFLFVTVSSRICGLIGTSANPISGMAIATLMATCAMFLAAGWTGGAYSALALTIGGVVCIAAANAGNTSQDLKTGYLVGATPARQQAGLVIGVLASVMVIGGTLILMNKGFERYSPLQMALNLDQLPEGVRIEDREFLYQQKSYVLINALGSSQIEDGKYLYDPTTQQIEVRREPGIGGQQAAAPQARLMATVINGILNRRLPWRLVLMGVFLVLAVELLGIRSLSFAVGSYLSIGTTMAIFAGGIVRWLAERGKEKSAHAESEVSPGSLYASGLIAAGGVVGLLAIILNLLQDREITQQLPGWMSFLRLPIPADAFAFGRKLIPELSAEPLFGVVCFAALAASLYVAARKRLA